MSTSFPLTPPAANADTVEAQHRVVEVQPLQFAELERTSSTSDRLAADLLADADKPSNPLHSIKTVVTVCVGQAALTVGELLGAKAQQVIRLDRLVDEPVDILLQGKVIARGHLVAVGEHFGIRITELPTRLTS